MDPVNEQNRLREEIREKVRRYYELAHRPAQEETFRPGESSVRYAGRVFDDRELCRLVDASLDFWLTAGRETEEFESKFGAFLGIRHTLFVNSGSSANLLAFMTLTSPQLGDRRIRRGDEVITVAAGFPTTVAPIVQFGACPVFVDVEEKTANIDPALLESALSEKTRAVMLAHSLGNPFQVDKVKAFCERHRLWLIEDNCDALGSRWNGRPTGTFGHLATSSFYPPHHLTTGEGGALYTDDAELFRIARSFRDWGRDCHCPSGVDNTCGQRFTRQYGSLPAGYDHKYVYRHFGYNLKATDLQAAIGCAQLEKIPMFVEKRRENFRILHQALRDLPGLDLPGKYPESDPSWFGFLLQVRPESPRTRDELVGFLEKNRIQTRPLFAGNLTRHPCCEALEEGVDYRIAGSLERTDHIMNNAFWIGAYPGMSRAHLDYMSEILHRAMTGKS